MNLIPTIYPYIVSNPGEAMVARDRIGAMMITHMTPAMAISGLYGNYTKLLNYIDRYNDQVANNVSGNAYEYKKLILELAPSLGFENLKMVKHLRHGLKIYTLTWMTCKMISTLMDYTL